MKTVQKSKKPSTAKSVALSGILAALCFVIMYIAAVTEILDLSGMIVCMVLSAVAVIEIGSYYPWLIWVVCGVLCFFFIPKKDIALEYIMFGGVYPVLKSAFEKLSAIPSWILKLVFFNAVFTGWFFLCRFIFAPNIDLTLGVVAYLAANAFFILSDVALTMMISFYIRNLRKRLKFGSKK